MRVEILRPVGFRGEIRRAGIVDAPDSTARHWLKTGAARIPAEPPTSEAKPADPPAHAASSGKKRF